MQIGDSPETHASMHFTTVPKLHLLKGGGVGVGGADVEVVGGQHGVRYPDGFFFTIFIYESYGDLGGFAGAKFLAAVVAVKNVFDCPHGVLLLVLYYSCGRGCCNLAVQVGDRSKLHRASLGQVWRSRSFYQMKMGLP